MVTDDKEDKNTMKKIQNSILGAAATLAACSLISALLLCGCSKDLQEQQAVSSLSEGDVELTIEVTGDAATRTTITHDNKILPVVWKTGDSLHVVGADAGYLGSVKLTEGAGTEAATFKGTVKGWSKAQVLHIYYLGTGVKLTSGQDAFTFDISKQGGTLQDVADSGHIAHGATASLAPGTKTIATSLTMSNLNAVVLFDLSKWTDGTTISGTYSSAVLNLKTGAFKTRTEGNITIAAGKCTGSTYVSFIPDTTALTFTQGSYSTPAMTNKFAAGSFSSNNGTAIDMPRLESECLLSEDFSISATVKVKFSRGNLQATRSADGKVTANGDGNSTWNFSLAEHQYDYIGYANSNDGALGNTIDLFGWSSNESGMYLYGISTVKNNDYYGNSSDPTTFRDWAGIPGLPSVAGRAWCTLTSDEWNYLLTNRTVNSHTGEGYSYQRTTLTLKDNSTMYGLIIAPDNFLSTLSGTTSWSSWQTLESAGCVFLPAGGYWNDSGLHGCGDSQGRYWSSTPYNSDWAYNLQFESGTVNPKDTENRFCGRSVRLVSVEIPEGALGGRFSVASDKRVRFSKGNLQATCSKAGTETTSEYSWGFAENQYDVIGNAEGNTTIASQTVGKKVDLFCWVGKSSTVLTGAATRYGITNSTAYSDYGTEKTTETLMDDWGNIATLPGNSENKKIWRTLTGGSDGEWKYLLETRSASTVNGQANARYAIVKVNGKVGLLLFPDVFTWPYDITKPTYINKVNESTDPNPDYTVDQFVVLQYAGCVFLPAGGRRQSSGVNHLTDGFYYSSNSRTTNISYRIAFGFNDFYSVQDSPFIDGCSVRLVTDVE